MPRLSHVGRVLLDDEWSIQGPYRHGRRWRVHLVRRRDGACRYRSFASEAAAQQYIGATVGEIAGGRTIQSAVDAYLASCRQRGLAEATIARARDHLRSILDLESNGRRPLAWLRGRGAELYDAERARPGKRPGAARAPDTHRGALIAARAWAAWAVKRELMRPDADPFAGIELEGRPRKGRNKPQHRADEASRLVAYCLRQCRPVVQFDAVAVLLAFILGDRAHEVVDANVRDVDRGGSLFWIDDAKTESGRRAVRVPRFLRPLLVAITKGREPEDPLLLAVDRPAAKRKLGTRRASRHWFWYHCRRICAEAGVPVISPHGLRRTHMSLAREAGATAEAVAAQAGQRSTSVQDRSYVAPDAAQAGRTARVLDVIDKPPRWKTAGKRRGSRGSEDR